jgi:hypothetical protein
VHRAIPLVLFLKLLIEVCLASLKKNYSSLASDAAQAIFTIRPASLSATTGSTVLYVINRFDLLNESNESINQIVIRLIRFVMRIRFDSLHSSNDGYVLITHKQKRSSPTTTTNSFFLDDFKPIKFHRASKQSYHPRSSKQSSFKPSHC